ncbi:hypothetical protein H671_2g4471 [Cricetulus griseus]|nr:hypothetical protein H671_2g4471 [Cricetulus griseus]
MGAGRPEIQGHPRLHSESETNLDYMRPVKKEREEDESWILNGSPIFSYYKQFCEELRYLGHFAHMLKFYVPAFSSCGPSSGMDCDLEVCVFLGFLVQAFTTLDAARSMQLPYNVTERTESYATFPEVTHSKKSQSQDSGLPDSRAEAFLPPGSCPEFFLLLIDLKAIRGLSYGICGHITLTSSLTIKPAAHGGHQGLPPA